MHNILKARDIVMELYSKIHDEPISIEQSRYVLKLGYGKKENNRITALLAKNKTSLITQRERDELRSMIDLGTIVETLQSKARLTLKKTKRPIKRTKTNHSNSKNGSSSSQSISVIVAENPWLRFAGSLKGDPDVSKVERIIAKQGDKWVPV